MPRFSTLREFINWLDEHGKLMHVKEPISREFELGLYLKKHGERPTLFENVKDSSMPVVAGIFTNRELLGDILGVPANKILYKLVEAFDNPSELSRSNEPEERLPVKLSELPIPKYFEKDGGYYFTAASVIAEDKKTGRRNVSIHRMMYLDEKHLAIRIVPRHLYEIYQESVVERNEPLPVVICNGAPPAVSIAAASSVPPNIFELNVASTLMGGLKTYLSPINKIEIPYGCEILIEGELTSERVPEGPFCDATGSYDEVRQEPVIEVKSVSVLPNPVFEALLPAGYEHYTLMGFPQEPRIYRALRSANINVQNVYLTPGGAGWLHAVVSIKKKKPKEGKNAIMAAFSGHPSLKRVVVVDEDIDITDPFAVEWAIAVRTDPLKDIVVFEAAGSTLDLLGRGNKWGIDATIPYEVRHPVKHQELTVDMLSRAKIPGEDNE